MWVVIGVKDGHVDKSSVRVYIDEEQALAWRNKVDESLDITRDSDGFTAPLLAIPIGSECVMMNL